MDLRQKVEAVLRQYLDIEIMDLEDDDGISGVIVSSQFHDMPVLDRQLLVETALRKSPKKLTKPELRRVLAIAPLTPAEYHAAGPR